VHLKRSNPADRTVFRKRAVHIVDDIFFQFAAPCDLFADIHKEHWLKVVSRRVLSLFIFKFTNGTGFDCGATITDKIIKIYIGYKEVICWGKVQSLSTRYLFKIGGVALVRLTYYHAIFKECFMREVCLPYFEACTAWVSDHEVNHDD